MLPLLLSALLAATPATPVVEVRALSFDEPRIALAVEDEAGKPAPITVHSHALTHGLKVRCPEGRLTFFREGKDAEGKPSLVPAVSAAVPPAGGTFVAIIHGRGERLAMSLVPDTGNRIGGGTLRFFNLCNRPLGLDFPGAREVLPAGRDFLLRPAVKADEYGQGRFLLAEGEEWKVAGGLRWLQLEDVRSLWFVMPDPSQPGIVVFRGIEERIAPEPAAPPANGAATAARRPAAR